MREEKHQADGIGWMDELQAASGSFFIGGNYERNIMERNILEAGMEGKELHELNAHEIAHSGAMAFERVSLAESDYTKDPSASAATELLLATAELAKVNHIRAVR